MTHWHEPRPASFIGSVALMLGALPVAALVSCGGEAKLPPPDIILISLDTLRQDRCSFHGYGRETTPFLAELGKDSLVFNRAYSTAPWTLISHATMLTGMYPAQHRVWERTAAISPSIPTLAERMSDHGMETRGVYFPGWLDPRFGFDRGFDEYREAKNADEAKAALDVMTDGFDAADYFLFVHLFDIHSDSLQQPGSVIYEVPEPYDSLFVTDARKKLEGIDADQAFNLAAVGFTPEMVDAVGALYDGGIRYVDDKLAAWFAEWEEDGMLENAIIIITSDHGEGLALRQHHFGGHGLFFEEGLKVPMIVHATEGARAWLKQERGLTDADLVGRRDDLVSHVDILPTVLDVLDLPSTMPYEGRSLYRQIPKDRIVHAQRAGGNAAYRGYTKATFDSEGRVLTAVDLAEDPKGLKEGRTTQSEVQRLGGGLAIDAQKAAAAFFDAGSAAKSGGLTEKAAADLRAIGYADKVDGKD